MVGWLVGLVRGGDGEGGGCRSRDRDRDRDRDGGWEVGGGRWVVHWCCCCCCCCCWLFNHEGTRRGEEFVTRKISTNVARIKNEYPSGEFFPLELGNIDSKRDWSDAEDFVEGIWLMLNQEKPKEYVLSSDETHTIREFVEEAFNFAGFAVEKCEWVGEGVDEKYLHEGKVLMQINPDFYRPAEVELLWGDSSKARIDLGWKPKSSFLDLVKKMVDHDLAHS